MNRIHIFFHSEIPSWSWFSKAAAEDNEGKLAFSNHSTETTRTENVLETGREAACRSQFLGKRFPVLSIIVVRSVVSILRDEVEFSPHSMKRHGEPTGKEKVGTWMLLFNFPNDGCNVSVSTYLRMVSIKIGPISLHHPEKQRWIKGLSKTASEKKNVWVY